VKTPCNYHNNILLIIKFITLYLLLYQSPSTAEAQVLPGNTVHDSLVVHYTVVHQNRCNLVIQCLGTGESLIKLLISDNSGYIVYRGVYSASSFKKIFLLPKEDNTLYYLQFQNIQTYEKQYFLINTSLQGDGVVKRIEK
jgi:hypothetical protein